MGEENQKLWIDKIENDTKITGINNYEGERESPWRCKQELLNPICLKLKKCNVALVISCS